MRSDGSDQGAAAEADAIGINSFGRRDRGAAAKADGIGEQQLRPTRSGSSS